MTRSVRDEQESEEGCSPSPGPKLDHREEEEEEDDGGLQGEEDEEDEEDKDEEDGGNKPKRRGPKKKKMTKARLQRYTHLSCINSSAFHFLQSRFCHKLTTTFN